MVTLPGHHMPDTPAQCGAALTNRIGLPVRLASSSPRLKVANHWIETSMSFCAVAKGAVAGLPPLSTVCANAGLAASRAIAETQRRCRHSKMVKRIPCEVSAVQLARGGVAAICRPAAYLRGIRTDFAAPTLVANFDRVAAKAEDPNPPVRIGNGQMFAAPMMRVFFIGPYSCGIA